LLAIENILTFKALADLPNRKYVTAIPQVYAGKSAIMQLKLEVRNCGLAYLPSTAHDPHYPA